MKHLLYSLLANESLVRMGVTCQFFLSYWLDFGNHKRKQFLLSIRPYTLVSYPRLVSLWNILENVEEQGIDGNLVECGVWKGGTAAIMAHVTQQNGSKRSVHLFDSFRGMPEPIPEDGARAIAFAGEHSLGKLVSINKTVASRKDVEKLFFSTLGLKKKGIFIHEGWFQEAIPKAKSHIGPIAVLRIDADWYESVKVCLEKLYDQVVPGGYVIVDDYFFWPGCRKAVDAFFQKQRIQPRLVRTDFSGIFMIKPPSAEAVEF